MLPTCWYYATTLTVGPWNWPYDLSTNFSLDMDF